MDLATGILIALVVVGTISSIALSLSVWNSLKTHSLKKRMGEFENLVSEQDGKIAEYKSAFLEIRDEIIPETRKNFELALFSGGDENSPIYATRTSVAKVNTKLEQIQLDLGAYRTKDGVLSLALPENVSQDFLSREDFGKFKNDLPVIVGKILEAREVYLAFQTSPLAPLGEKGLDPRVGLALIEAEFDSLQKIASLKKGDESWDKFIGALGKNTDPEALIQAAKDAISEVEKRRELEAENVAFKKSFLVKGGTNVPFPTWKRLKGNGFSEPEHFTSVGNNVVKFLKLAEISGNNAKALEYIQVAEKTIVDGAKEAIEENDKEAMVKTATVLEESPPTTDAAPIETKMEE